MNRTDIFFQTKFLKSAFSIQDLPDDIGSEVSFCGRSNSGKSSVLNALTGNKKLAKISKTPGRTQSMNIFSLDPSLQKRIVDLPGYGFSSKPENEIYSLNYFNKKIIELLDALEIQKFSYF